MLKCSDIIALNDNAAFGKSLNGGIFESRISFYCWSVINYLVSTYLSILIFQIVFIIPGGFSVG